VQRNLDALAGETFDVLIIGGGITGAGVALDAATRGWRVALIDQGDFASGTSSVSSKLIHGGLRYLERLQIQLVYEALHERRLLLANAPHLVQPLQFLLPFYGGARVPGWKWRLGLSLYDLLAGKANLKRSRPLSAGGVSANAPGLCTDHLTGGAAYFDAQMDDARLCLEVLKTAAVHGAVLANYVQATAFEKAGGVITGVHALDRIGKRELRIRAQQTVNATGPWLDSVCQLAGDTSAPCLEPTKGVHVVIPGRGLISALLLLHPRDGRVFFVIPWLGKTLIGTTDTLSCDGPDACTVLPEDVDYLMEGYRHFFPGDPEPGLLGAFAGLRPLLKARAGEPSARSREFRLFRSAGGLLSVAGGKYTTFRHMAEVITDRIGRRLGRRARCRTHRVPLASAPREPWPQFKAKTVAELVRNLNISAASAERLAHRYGADTEKVAPYLTSSAAREPIVAGEPELRGELDYQRDHEMALRPEDHYLRRLRLGLYCRQLTAIY
jgi:glycerol-3-phosphate dehydrogenase